MRLVQNRGVAKATTKGRFAAKRSGIESLSRVVSSGWAVLILVPSPPTSLSVGVRAAGAAAPMAGVASFGKTLNWFEAATVLPATFIVTTAVHAPAAGSGTSAATMIESASARSKVTPLPARESSLTG